MAVIDSFLRSMISLSSETWLNFQSKTWFPSCWMVLKSNYTSVGCHRPMSHWWLNYPGECKIAKYSHCVAPGKSFSLLGGVWCLFNCWLTWVIAIQQFGLFRGAFKQLQIPLLNGRSVGDMVHFETVLEKKPQLKLSDITLLYNACHFVTCMEAFVYLYYSWGYMGTHH